MIIYVKVILFLRDNLFVLACRHPRLPIETWVIVYMFGNLIKSSFQCIQWHVIWTSEQGVMIIFVKTVQKGKRPAGIEDHFRNASTVGLPPSNIETSVHSYPRDLFLV